MSLAETVRQLVVRRPTSRLVVRGALLALLGSAACLNGDVAAILPGAPGITTQPVGRTVTEGDPVSLSIVATGNSPVFQWYKDGAKVDSATTTTLNITAAKLSDAGVYFVTVSNAIGTFVSDTARLIVNAPVAVTGYTLASGSASFTNKTYASTTADQSAVWVSGTGDLTLISPTVTKSGDASSVSTSARIGTNAGVLASGGSVLIIDGAITTSGVGASGLFATGAGTHLAITRGSVTTTGASSFAAGASLGAVLDLARTKLRTTSGTLLSATNGGTITLLAEADSLSGLVTADASSTIALSLTKGATLTGGVQLAKLSLDSTSTWNVTGASTVTGFTDPLVVTGGTVTNVIGNGFTVTYDATRPENAALGGRTYALTGGGSLAPR